MSEDQNNKDERNATFKRFIEDNSETIREHSDSQPKTIKPDDEWADEHEWTEMHEELVSIHSSNHGDADLFMNQTKSEETEDN